MTLDDPQNISPSKDGLKRDLYWANNWRDPLSPALIYSNMRAWKRGRSEDARNSWCLRISQRCGALQVPPRHKHSNLEYSHTAAEWLEAIYFTSTGLLAQYTNHTHTNLNCDMLTVTSTYVQPIMHSIWRKKNILSMWSNCLLFSK